MGVEEADGLPLPHAVLCHDYRNRIIAGVPTAVYCPVTVSAPVWRVTRKQATASLLWLHE